MKYKYGFESIFDHNPTSEELDLFGIRGESDIPRYAKLVKEEEEPNFVDLARLYHHRGKDAEVEKYLSKIEDPQLKFDTEYGFQDCAVNP